MDTKRRIQLINKVKDYEGENIYSLQNGDYGGAYLKMITVGFGVSSEELRG
jgi:hypothetical protein